MRNFTNPVLCPSISDKCSITWNSAVKHWNYTTMARQRSCFIEDVDLSSSGSFMKETETMDFLQTHHYCLYCSRNYFVSQPKSFSVVLKWNIRCEWQPETTGPVVVLSKCKPCTHGWLEICLILILMFIVWMVFMPFRKDRFLFALTICQVMLSLLLCLWGLVSWWIFMAAILVFVLKLGRHSRHNLIGILVSYLQVIFAVFPYKIQAFMPQNKELSTLLDTIQKFINLSGFHQHCWLLNFYEEILSKLIFMALLPILVSCFSWIGFGIWYAFSDKQNKERLNLVRNSCGSFCLSFFGFAYFPILNYVSSFIRLKSCMRLNQFMPGGGMWEGLSSWISVIKKYPWLDCRTNQLNHVYIIAIIITIIYIAIPYICFLPLLYKHRIQISNEREELNENFWFSVIYLQYKAKYRVFMHTIILTKKILMALVVSFNGTSALLGQVASVSLLLLCSLMPFKKGNNSVLRCRFLGLTQAVSKIGMDNFFQIGFELSLLNAILFKLIQFEYSAAFRDGGSHYSDAVLFISGFTFGILTASVILLWVVYVIAPFCPCRRQDHSKRRSLTVIKPELHNKYASLSKTYILTDASHIDDDDESSNLSNNVFSGDLQ